MKGSTSSGEPGPHDPGHQAIALLKSGNNKGLEVLLEAYGGAVRHWLDREFGQYLGDQIDDALANAGINVLKYAKSYDDGKGTPRAWFYRIARNCALELVLREKKWRKQRVGGWDLDAFTSAAKPEADVRRGGAHDELDKLPKGDPAIDPAAALRDCLDRLPTLQRTILTTDLTSDGTMTTRMIAEAIGTSMNSVYASRTYARKKLRKCLKDHGHEWREGPS